MTPRKTRSTPTVLGDILTEVDLRAGNAHAHLPVLSLTKDRGLIPQTERFKHRVATEDVSTYKVVRPHQIVHNPYVLWEGAIHALRGEREGLVSPVYPVWEVGQDAHWSYVDFLLRTKPLIDRYEQLCSGVVKRRRSVSKSAFLSIRVPLPPRDEQQRIATMLSIIQRAIQTRDATIRSMRQLLDAMRAELFAGAGPARTLHELGADVRYGTSERCVPDGVGPPVFGIKNIGEIDVRAQGASRLPRIPTRSDKCWLRPGDLLFVRTNADQARIGRCSVYEGAPETAMFASYLLRVRVHEPEMSSRFIAHYAASRVGAAALRLGGSGAADGKFNLNAPTLGTWQVPAPPLARQLQIVEYLDICQRALMAHEASLQALTPVFQSLLVHLMEAAE